MSRNRSENENTQCHCISSSFLCVSLRLSQIKSAYQFGKSMLHMKFSEKRMKILRDKQWFSQFNFALMTVSSHLNCSTKLAVLKFCCLSIFDANVFQINAVEQFWNFALHASVARKQMPFKSDNSAIIASICYYSVHFEKENWTQHFNSISSLCH